MMRTRSIWKTITVTWYVHMKWENCRKIAYGACFDEQAIELTDVNTDVIYI